MNTGLSLKAGSNAYPHFMLKEIYEQPQSILRLIQTMVRVDSKNNLLRIDLPFIDQLSTSWKKLPSLHIVACGTAWHAGYIAKYYLETFARLPVVLEIASEHRYRENLLNSSQALLVISQSGETADTLAAVKLAQKKGVKTIGLINVPNSPIARAVDYCLLTQAGPEIGIASTKAFTAQVLAVYLLALKFAEIKKLMSPKQIHQRLKAVQTLPDRLQATLALSPAIQKLVKKVKTYKTFVFIGRGYFFPLSLEGALKLKEVCYDHAEGFAAGELKHGPIAIVDKSVLTLAICPHNSSTYAKTISIIQEVKLRAGHVVALGLKSDAKLAQQCDAVICVDDLNEELLPLIFALPLQLFTYYLALMRGTNIDKPRNLSKSVTVE